MRQIVPGVYLVEGLSRAHVYLLVSEGGLTLVDSGVAGEVDLIVAQLEDAGYALSNLQYIVLTHHHSDHVGNAAELARRSGAQVMAHRGDVPYIERTEPLPPGPFLRWLLSWLGDRLFQTDPCQVDGALQDGDMVDALNGLRVIHVPGHTPGSIVLYQPERQILFCGDVLFNDNPLSSKEGLQLPPRIFSTNAAQAQESARKLVDLSVEVLCLGHGEPILEGVGGKIRKVVG